MQHPPTKLINSKLCNLLFAIFFTLILKLPGMMQQGRSSAVSNSTDYWMLFLPEDLKIPILKQTFFHNIHEDGKIYQT